MTSNPLQNLREEACHSVLSSQQETEFHEKGLVYIPNLVSENAIGSIQEDLWTRLEKEGVFRGQPYSWEDRDEASIKAAIKRTRKHGSLKSIYSPRSDHIASRLTGSSEVSRTKPLLLLTFSKQHGYLEDLRVPATMWHTDTPNLPGIVISGLIMLCIVEKVEARGGGTMVLAGSHRLISKSKKVMKSRDLKRRLKADSPLACLFNKHDTDRERFLSEAIEVNDIPTQVVELTGEPGGVWFVNGLCLHTIAKNFLTQPRVMIRGFYETQGMKAYYQERFGTD